MLNFLPQKNKKKIIIEYFTRLLIALLTFLLFAVVLLMFLFIPSAIFSKYKNNTVKNQLSSINIADANKGQDQIDLIKRVNAMVGILSNKKTENIPMTDMIQKVILLKNDNIKVLSISISEYGTSSEKIIVNGVAKTRDDLTMFDKNLINNGSFYSVDLPVSNLIKNIDAQFTITLVYNKK